MTDTFWLYDISLVLGKILFNSLWQFLLIALLFQFARGILRLLVRKRAQYSNLVYWSGCLALLAMAIAPVVTAFWLVPEQQALVAEHTLFPELVEPMVNESSEAKFLQLPNPEVTQREFEAVLAMPSESGSATTQTFAQIFELLSSAEGAIRQSYPWLVAAWMIGVLLFAFRPFLSLRRIGQLRSNAITAGGELTADQRSMLEKLQSRFTCTVALSNSINIPVVAGLLKPIIVLPVSLLSHLSMVEMELVLRHELAHIRRNDLFVNLLQVGIETVYFYHPCVWWVSRIVRQERENCCDDMVVVDGNETDYAKALFAIEQARHPALALSSQGGNLLNRLERMLATEASTDYRYRHGWELCIPLLMSIIFAGGISLIGMTSTSAWAGESSFAATQDSAFERQTIRKNFSRTKLGKRLELEMRKSDQVGFTGTILVAHKGEIILAASEGVIGDEGSAAIAPNALFEIASATKSFTSVAALILAEQGKLDPDASIADYLRNVPVSCQGIKVKHLMQHRSGIPGDRYGNYLEGIDTAVKTMLGNGPTNVPGSQFEYWNQGYILLSEIVSKAAGKPFEDVIRELILEPCNMQGTCFLEDSAPKNFVPTIGKGTLGADRSCLEHPYGGHELSYRGTGGMVSNVFDMWKFHYALQNGRLLKPASIKSSIDIKPGSPYGMGWFVRKMQSGQQVIWNGGKVRGFNCEYRRYADSDSCIVVLSNRDDAPTRMLAGVLEGVLFPPDPQTQLANEEAKKFEGHFRSDTGRELVLELRGKKVAYTVYWGPGNPNAPVSRGYIQRDKDKNLVMYQSNEVSPIKIEFNKDESKVKSVAYKDMDLKFDRIDAKDSLAKSTPALPDKLDKSEEKLFVGNYDSGVGPSLEIKREQGRLIFTMYWQAKRRNGRKTVGYVMKYNDKEEYVLYHPRSPLTIEFELHKNKSKVQQITSKELNMTFKRK